MLVTLYVAGQKEMVNKKEKHGGGMRQWRVQQNKKGNYGRSGRKEAAKKTFGGKRKAKSGVYVAKKNPRKKLENSDSKNLIFILAKRMKRENQDIVGDECVKNDEVCLTYDYSAKLKA